MLNSLVKDNIKSLSPYKVEQNKGMVKLDANENNNVAYLLNEKLAEAITKLKINEYPDSDCTELRTILAKELDADVSQIMVGCGSDQLISIIMTVFVGDGDKMLTYVPTFGMYKIVTQTVGGTAVEVPLSEDFSLDLENFIEIMEKEKPKVVFLTNPNNPTGSIIPRDKIIKILQSSRGIVVVDEAYYEFYGESVIDLVDEYKNLIVLRTLSKAYGLAGARVGYGIASKQLMDILYKVKPPYNVANLSQLAAKVCLMNRDIMENAVRDIVEERERMANLLKKIPNLKVFDSHANFILCRMGCVESVWNAECAEDTGCARDTGNAEDIKNAKDVYNYLLDNRVLVRYFGEEGPLANCLRISIGTKEENELVLNLLRGIL